MDTTIPRRRLCPQCKTKLIRPQSICCSNCVNKIRDITEEAAEQLIQRTDTSSMTHIPYSSRSMIHLSKYGLTHQDYDAMLVAQKGQCALCGKQPGAGDYLVVDHCHYSGVVRELLCRNCNVMLGFANDNIEFLQKSIEYLIKHTT